jgi:pimeloyl-ACP methyl ester carboxylesterase
VKALARRRLVVLIVGLSVVAISLVMLGERFFGRTRLRFPYLGTPLPVADYAELASRPGWSRQVLRVAPGTELRGLIRRPVDPGAPWVLFYPGNDATQLRTGQRVLTALAHERDWGLAVFAYRGFDSSNGTFDYQALLADAPALLRQLRATLQLSPERVHLAGFSIGGHFAVAAAAGAARDGAPAAGLLLLAPVDDIVMVRPTPWQRLSSGDDYQTRPLLADVPRPVLVLQGGADEALQGPGQGRAIADALGARARYEQYEGVGHEALLAHEPALAAGRAFISATMTAPTR